MKKVIVKRGTALILILLLLLSVCPTYAGAAYEEPTIYVENMEATAGTAIFIPVYIQNNPGFSGMRLYFDIPSGFSIESYVTTRSGENSVLRDYNEDEDGWNVVGFIQTSNDVDGKGIFVYGNNANRTRDGVICWVKYNVSEDAVNGTYTLSISTDSLNNDEEVMIIDQFDFVPGTITVTGGQEPVAATVEVTPETDTVAVPTKAAVGAGNPTTVQMSAVVKNQIGGVMEGQSVTWGLQDNPEGVSISDSGLVTVDNTAEDGEITVVAKCGSAEGSCQLTLTKETSAVTAIEASDKSVDVPTQGQPNSTVELTAKVFDQYGVPMNDKTVNWTMEGTATGVSLSGDTITVTKDAQQGSVTVTASCEGKTDTATVTIRKAAAVPEAVVIQKGGENVANDSITIPQSGSNDVTYTAVVYDQYGAEMENPAVTWKLTRTGAGVSQTDGTVTVTPGAAAGTYILEADCGGKTAQVAISVAGITFEEVFAEVGDERVYGMTWAEIITDVSGKATIDGTVINGAFSILDPDVVPDAGDQTYTIVFTGGGYENITAQTGSVNILPKPVTVRGITAQNKLYDGSTDAAFVVDAASIEDFVEGDSLTVASATGAFGDKNVGTGKNVNISEIILGGADAANYTVGSQSQNETYASITPKPVSVSGITARDKEYDGDTTAELDCSKAAVTGKVDGDDLTVDSATGAFEDKNAGDDKPVSISEIILGGEDAGNYARGAGSQKETAASITAKTLTEIDAAAVTVSKEYDGTVAAGAASGTVAFEGAVSHDQVGITAAAGDYADKNAGTGKTVTLQLSLTGEDAGNYKLKETAVTIHTAAITACAAFTDATATEQNVVVGVGAFAEPVFTGVDGEAVTGTSTYTINGESASYDEIVGHLKSLTKGETASIGYSFTANGNYTGVKTGFITVTMVDILFTVDGQPATSENAVTVQTNPTYGQSWNEIVSIAAISATLNGQPVTGSYSLVTEKEIPAAGPQQYVVRFTVGEKSYDVCGGTVTIAPKALTITGVGAEDKIYDGTVKADATGDAVLNGVVGEDIVTVKAGTAAFTDKDAGMQTVTFTGYGIEGEDAGNYTVSQPAPVQAQISRKSVTITGVVVADQTYDGSTAATVTNAGIVEEVVPGDIVTAQAGAAQFTSADAGENITVVFSGFTITGEDAGNYILSGQPANGQADITKANYSGTPLVNINVLINQEIATQGSLSVADFFTTVPAEAEITAVTPKTVSNHIMDSVTASGGEITYTSGVNLPTANLTDTYEVTISTKNYNDIPATLTFTTVDKTPVTVSGVAVADKTYDGKALTYTGTPAAMTAGGETVAASGFTYTWKDSEGHILTSAPKNAGSYTLTVAVVDDQYTGSVTLNCTISKAAVTITALDVSAPVGSKLPTFSYRVAGLAEGESLKTEPTLTCVADMNQAGTYAIKASGAEVPEGGNYHDTITYVDGKLTVYYYNTANRVTVYGGAHGIARVDDYNPAAGDRVTITVTPDEGYEVDQVLVTTASGKKVPVTRTGENRYVFEMPSGSVSIQVTYKAEEKVAYTDVSPYAWYAEAVEYVTVQGLMNGVGEGKFAPSATVTRAMVWTVLARMDGENTEGGSAWYSKARTWAMENGVSDGANPEAAITREQLATMLYRYCGSPAVSGSLSGYADGSSVSDWAEDAMLWAIEQGLIEGVGDNKLAPDADTTRAQLAQILMRFDKKF